jgi:hypothetical protein
MTDPSGSINGCKTAKEAAQAIQVGIPEQARTTAG